MSDFTEGDTVYDRTTPAYEIVEFLDGTASQVVAKPEKKDRGHTIYEEKTVADLNQEFPQDDKVVRVRRLDTGREVLWPVSRLAESPEEISGDT